MFTRTLKQKLLLSMQVPHRLGTFINQKGKGAYKDHFLLKDGLVLVQQNNKDDKLEKYPLYQNALVFGCKTNQEIWDWLKKNNLDFNSRFKKEFNVTLDEYTQQILNN